MPLYSDRSGKSSKNLNFMLKKKSENSTEASNIKSSEFLSSKLSKGNRR